MAATYYCIDPQPAVGLPGEVHTSKQNDLGTVRRFSVSGTAGLSSGVSVPMYFIYLQGVGSTVAGSVVVFGQGVFTTALVATGVKGSCAVATAAPQPRSVTIAPLPCARPRAAATSRMYSRRRWWAH